jgi:hypothetical protein
MTQNRCYTKVGFPLITHLQYLIIVGRHKKPFLVVDENGETHIAIYATVDIRDGDMFIGEYEPKWVIREIYSDRNFEVIEKPKAWSWLPTFV